MKIGIIGGTGGMGKGFALRWSQNHDVIIGSRDASRASDSAVEYTNLAKHTAEIIGKHNSLDVITDDRLIELDMGKFTGMPYDEIFNSHGNVFMKFYNGELEIAHNGVETFSDVKKRILGIVDHIIEKHPDENVLLVTHMDPIKAMLSTVIDLSPTNLYELILPNASLTIFRESDKKFSLSGLNVMDPSRFDHGWS